MAVGEAYRAWMERKWTEVRDFKAVADHARGKHVHDAHSDDELFVELFSDGTGIAVEIIDPIFIGSEVTPVDPVVPHWYIL